jgi:hypothetical protein
MFGNLATSMSANPQGTGGGGLFDAFDGTAGGGGGSHGYPAYSAAGMTNNEGSFIGQPTAGNPAVMGMKGGGGDYFGFIGGGVTGQYSFAAQSKGYEPESYFDIVNCSLKGTGGYGVYNYVASQWSMAGTGGPGSGGGGIFGNQTGHYNLGGSGGTGGGGGGVSASGSSGRLFGGAGGLGGGGGGAYGAGGNPTIALGGKGGICGGGGGAATYSGSSQIYATGGNGGNGCVMVFWKG